MVLYEVVRDTSPSYASTTVLHYHSQ